MAKMRQSSRPTAKKTRPDTKSTRTESAEILIIGGGHAGLSLTACLGAAGFNVICLERGEDRRKKPAQDGRTLALSYRTMQVLGPTGIEPLIKREACPIFDIRIADQNSPVFLDFDHRDVGSAAFGWIIENPFFTRALYQRIGAMKNVRLIFNATVEDIEENASCIRVTLKDGRTFEAALLAGADGRNSQCRKLANIPVYGWDYGQTAIVCTIQHSLPHNNVAVEHFQPGGPFATLPMTQQRSSIVWTEKTDAAEALIKMGRDDFTDLLQQKVASYLGDIELLGERFSHPLNLQHARNYGSGRMVLVGDAAHGIHPIAGQGFNLGMGDIQVLVEELTRALQLGLDLGSPILVQRFEKRRKVDNSNMVLATDLLDRLFSTAQPQVQSLRRAGLGLVQQIPPLKRFFMRTAMGVRAF